LPTARLPFCKALKQCCGSGSIGFGSGSSISAAFQSGSGSRPLMTKNSDPDPQHCSEIKSNDIKSFFCMLCRYKSRKDMSLAGSSHQGSVQGLTFTSCGRFLLSLGSDRRVRKVTVVSWEKFSSDKLEFLLFSGSGFKFSFRWDRIRFRILVSDPTWNLSLKKCLEKL
jgi:hypothetical protein